MALIAIDIETFRADNDQDWWNKTTIRAPSNYKDLEKIEAYIEKERAKLSEKSALHWYVSKIISVAIVNVETREELVICHKDEKTLLELLVEAINPRDKLIGKNSKSFDFPFIVGRLMANEIKIPQVFKSRYDLLDVDDFFGYGQNSSKGKLDAYAFGLDIDGKSGSGGNVAKLWEAYLSGDEASRVELEQYNLNDSLIVAEMARRYFAKGEL